MRDPDTGNSKGFAFINYASFEASDAAIEAMNGQHLCNRAITVSYAFKKESKGERHGSAAGETMHTHHELYGNRAHAFGRVSFVFTETAMHVIQDENKSRVNLIAARCKYSMHMIIMVYLQLELTTNF